MRSGKVGLDMVSSWSSEEGEVGFRVAATRSPGRRRAAAGDGLRRTHRRGRPAAGGRGALRRGVAARTPRGRPGSRDVGVARALDLGRPERRRRVVHARMPARRARRSPGSTGRSVPWAWQIRSPGMKRPIEWRPSVTISAGSSTSSWRWRYGAQAAISSGCGSRLSGGRHLTMFVMKTSSRLQPSGARNFVSSAPARPTNGRPSRSSLNPGPSPTNTTSVSGLPSPGTARVRVSWRRQRVQARTSVAISSSAAWRSAWVTPAPGDSGGLLVAAR